jgi:hypothetical protein
VLQDGKGDNGGVSFATIMGTGLQKDYQFILQKIAEKKHANC